MITTDRGHDPLADVFARFTADAAGEIVPPGAAAARRVGRSRRHTTRIAGAWLGLLLVGAGWAVTATHDGHTATRDGRHTATHPSKPASPIGPLYTKFDRRILAQNWLTLPDSPATAGQLIGTGYNAAPGEADVHSGGLLDGRFRLTFDCVLTSGAGPLVATFEFVAVRFNGPGFDSHGPEGPQGSTSATVRCDDPDTIAYHALELDANATGYFSVTFQADAQVTADAGIAWRVTQLTEGR